MPATRPLAPYSDNDDDSSGDEPVIVPTAKKTATRKASSTAPGRDAGKRQRTASKKQAANDKENMEKLQRDNEKLKKALKKAQKAQGNDRAEDDDDLESEDPLTDAERPIGASGRIRALEPLAQTVDKPRKLRKLGSGDPKAKKVKMSSLLDAPEPTPEEAEQDSRPTPSPPSSPQQPPRSYPNDDDDDDSMHIDTPATSSPSQAAAERRKSKRAAPPQPEAPAVKRHDDARLPEFRESFVAGSGKPKARDYVPVDAAIIVRACLGYTRDLLAENALPSAEVQAVMLAKNWREACRIARVRMKLTDRVSKIILARGSQVRGKIIDAFRALVAGDFGLERSTKRKVIKANKTIVESVTREGDATFHYKDPKAEEGYGEHKTIAAVRKLTVFRDKKAAGARFPSTFNPIPIPLMALEFTALEFALGEWETGSHVASKFTEKDISDSYQTHLADITRWTKINPETTLKLREKWYKRVASTFLSASAKAATTSNLTDKRVDKLRAQLENRTGETDSEPEEDDDDDDNAEGPA